MCNLWYTVFWNWNGQRERKFTDRFSAINLALALDGWGFAEILIEDPQHHSIPW